MNQRDYEDRRQGRYQSDSQQGNSNEFSSGYGGYENQQSAYSPSRSQQGGGYDSNFQQGNRSYDQNDRRSAYAQGGEGGQGYERASGNRGYGRNAGGFESGADWGRAGGGNNSYGRDDFLDNRRATGYGGSGYNPGNNSGNNAGYERDWGHSPYARNTGDDGRDNRGGAHRDPDYHQWREEQIRNLDSDYDSWRQERYSKFSDDFNNWRTTRSQTSGKSSGATGGGGAGASSGDSTNTSSTKHK